MPITSAAHARPDHGLQLVSLPNPDQPIALYYSNCPTRPSPWAGLGSMGCPFGPMGHNALSWIAGGYGNGCVTSQVTTILFSSSLSAPICISSTVLEKFSCPQAALKGVWEIDLFGVERTWGAEVLWIKSFAETRYAVNAENILWYNCIARPHFNVLIWSFVY
jgi:hypothetical protein